MWEQNVYLSTEINEQLCVRAEQVAIALRVLPENERLEGDIFLLTTNRLPAYLPTRHKNLRHKNLPSLIENAGNG